MFHRRQNREEIAPPLLLLEPLNLLPSHLPLRHPHLFSLHGEAHRVVVAQVIPTTLGFRDDAIFGHQDLRVSIDVVEVGMRLNIIGVRLDNEGISLNPTSDAFYAFGRKQFIPSRSCLESEFVHQGDTIVIHTLYIASKVHHDREKFAPCASMCQN